MGFYNSHLLQDSKMVKRVRIVLVGTGRMGAIRAKIMYANPKIDLCGVCDVNVDSAKELASTYSVS